MEPDTGDEPLGEKKTKGFDGQVSIHVHSKRNKLTDPDGCASKYVIDALVTAGVLPDDRPEIVSGVTHSQEKTKGPEITEITIRPFTGFWGGSKKNK